QAALTGAFGQVGHAAVVQVTAAVEYDHLDPLGQSGLGNGLPHLAGGGLVAAVALELQGGSGAQGDAVDVVDHLGVDILLTAEHVQAGALGSAGDLRADALVSLQTLSVGVGSLNHVSARLLTSSRRSYRPCGG